MIALASVTNGPWRIRTSPIEDRIVVTYHIGGKSEVIASETPDDIRRLRDALTEYLDTVEEVD